MENRTQIRSDVLDLLRQWPGSEDDIMVRSANVIEKMLQNDIDWLQTIKRQLLSEQHGKKIVCKHSKKDSSPTNVDSSGTKIIPGK